MKRFISIITATVMVMALFSMPFASAADTTREYGIYTRAEIADAKERIEDTSDTATAAAWEQFQTAVNWALTEEPSAVATLKIPGSYYDSTNHNTYRKMITNDAYAAYTLALAWQLTGTTDYADKAAAILDEWATVNTSIPYDDTNDTDDANGGYFDNPLVAAYGGVGFIYAAELISEYTGWSETDQTAFKTWVANVYGPAVYAAATKTYNNNWNSWGLLASIASNYYLGNTTKIASLKTLLKNQINIQINNQGQLESEIERGANGMWYTYFSLAPLTQAIQYVYNITGGEDNYFYYTGVGGGSVTKALNHFLPYVEDTASWESDYNVTLGLKPVLDTTGRCWPLNLYEAMRYIYGQWDENEDGAGYEDLADKYDPIPGGAITYSSSMNMHHIVWSFPSLMQPTNIITSSVLAGTDYPEYLTDDFEGYDATGSLDDSIKWTETLYPNASGSTDGISAVVAVDPTDSTNHALKLTDTLTGTYNSTTGTGVGCVEVTGDTQPQYGLSTASFRFMLGGTLSKSSNSGIHISGLNSSSEYTVVASIVYVYDSTTSTGNFILRTGSGTSMIDEVVYASPSANTWYDFKFVLNSDMETFDLYIGDTLVADNHDFRFSASYDIHNVCRIKFATDSPATGTVNYIDDVFIGQLDYIEDNAESYSTGSENNNLLDWAVYKSTSKTTDSTLTTVEAGVCADPYDSTNQVFYVKDQSKTDCVELRADMRAKEGLCYVNVDALFSVADLSANSYPSFSSGIHLQDATRSEASVIASIMYWSKWGLYLNGLSTTGVRGGSDSAGYFELVSPSDMSNSTWYNFKFVIDTYNQTFDVYVDNELKGSDLQFRTTGATKLSRFKLTTNEGGGSYSGNTLNYFDNIFAGDLNYKVIDAEVTDGGLKAKVLHDEMHADIYTAAYDAEGRLLSVAPLDTVDGNLTTLTDVEGTLSTTGTIDTYKVFIFENNGVNPLCSSFEKAAQ